MAVFFSHPQVEDVKSDLLSTNLVSTAMYWNVLGTLVSLFVFLYDAVLPVMAIRQQNGDATILGMGIKNPLYVWIVAGVVYATLIPAHVYAIVVHKMPNAWYAVNPLFAVGYIVFPLVLLVVLLLAVQRQLANPEVTMLQTPALMRDGQQEVDIHPMRKSAIYWIAYAMAAPYVGSAMYMLLQRRDWILNGAMALSVLAAALCPLAIEMMHSFFVDAMTEVRCHDRGKMP